VGQYKATDWYTIRLCDCEIIDIESCKGVVESIQVRHVDFGRPRWFAKSRKGNFYWRRSGKSYENAEAYIITTAFAWEMDEAVLCWQQVHDM